MAEQPGESPPPALSGLLIIDKPYDLTSMTVCRAVKRRLVNGGFPKKTKVGHGGTLDPLATGVMVVLVGKACKRCDEVMAGEKRYTAEIDLSRRSSLEMNLGVSSRQIPQTCLNQIIFS